VADSPYELKSLSPTGQAPKSRIQSAQATRDMYGRARYANEKRRMGDALVKGMIDGNRPFDQGAIEKNGQRYRANFNNGEAESFLNSSTGAFYDLFSEVERRVTVKIPGSFAEKADLEDAIAEEFDALIREDDTFDWSVQCSISDMVEFGIGPQIWEDPYTWRPRRWRHDELDVPDGSPSNVVDWERCFLTCNYRVDELYGYIADEEAARKAGWNVAAVKRAIIRAAERVDNKPFYGNGTGAWIDYQQWIRNNDISVGDQCDRVRVARFLYKEFPGEDGVSKISEAWVAVDDSQDDFLFQEERVYQDFRQALCCFYYDRGDGTHHSVRGLGVKMFHLLMAKMRLQNGAVDAASMRGALMFQSRRAGESNRAQLGISSHGPFAVIPDNLEYINVNSASALDAPMAVMRDLDGTLAANLGQYRARLEKPEGNPRTAFEVSAELQKQSILGKTQIQRYYQQLDEFYAEMYRRASNPEQSRTNYWQRKALEFQDRCAERGVPREVMKKAVVRAMRTVGQGSPYMRALALGQTVSELYAVLPEDGKQRLVNDVIAARFGRDHIARYNPEPPVRAYEQQQRWEAQVENDTLRNRGQVSITVYQNDTIHLQEHLGFASQAAQSLQQGADPAEILGILQAAGQHCALHLERLAANPTRKDEFKALEAQWKALARIADQLEEQLQQQMEQQAQQAAVAQQAQAVESGTDPETQLKTAQAQRDMQIKEYKAKEQVRLKEEKQAADLALKDAKTAQDIRIKSIKDAQAIQATAIKDRQAITATAVKNAQQAKAGASKNNP